MRTTNDLVVMLNENMTAQYQEENNTVYSGGQKLRDDYGF